MRTKSRGLIVNSVVAILGIVAVYSWRAGRTVPDVVVTAAAQGRSFNCPGSAAKALPDPFANNYGQTPSGYSGPLFKLSHRYPTTKPTKLPNPPWRQALNGAPISAQNAVAYVNALKAFVAADMRQLISHYDQWDADARGWYNEPWIAFDREAVHGAYLGTPFPAGTFTDLKSGMATWVLTYYGRNSAYTVGQVWGADAKRANVQPGQYQEDAVIVKIAATTATPQNWPSMQGAATWQLYACPVDMSNGPNQGNPTGPPALMDVRIFQVDLIVKDTATAPKTGWVFATLVHDGRVNGDAWDKLVPLGAMWGNDPNNTTTTLNETVINAAAPAYAKETLGWNGRLSGPNDAAVVAPASINGQQQTSVAASSCMSCHGPAEVPLRSFILPSPSPAGKPGAPTFTANGVMVLNPPGSAAWNQWFQDRNGTTPQDQGTVAVDYDMVLAFKSIPAWNTLQGNLGAAPLPTRTGRPRLYNGK